MHVGDYEQVDRRLGIDVSEHENLVVPVDGRLVGRVSRHAAEDAFPGGHSNFASVPDRLRGFQASLGRFPAEGRRSGRPDVPPNRCP